MKHTKIIIAAILALTLTACSDTTTEKDTALIDEVTSDTVMTEETTAAETTTSAETEAETDQTEAEETVDINEDTSIIENKNEISKTYTDILISEADSGCMSLKANLIDLNSDGVSELVVTSYRLTGYDYHVYKSDGSEVQGLWNDYSLLEDYASVETEYSFQQYKNTETGNAVVMYVCQGNGMGMPKLFTYAMDAVMLPESLTAEAVTVNDYTAREMNMTVYSNGEALGTAKASSTRNDDGNPFWNDWDNLEELDNLYNSYFGKYEFVSENISSLNPIKINDTDEIFFDGEFIVSSDELTELISTILSEQ